LAAGLAKCVAVFFLVGAVFGFGLVVRFAIVLSRGIEGFKGCDRSIVRRDFDRRLSYNTVVGQAATQPAKGFASHKNAGAIDERIRLPHHAAAIGHGTRIRTSFGEHMMKNLGRGIKAAVKGVASGFGPARYQAGGVQVGCTHCKEALFREREVYLRMVGWMSNSSTALVCEQCGLIQWFAKPPERLEG
jgi:hypothetical protein